MLAEHCSYSTRDTSILIKQCTNAGPGKRIQPSLPVRHVHASTSTHGHRDMSCQDQQTFVGQPAEHVGEPIQRKCRHKHTQQISVNVQERRNVICTLCKYGCIIMHKCYPCINRRHSRLENTLFELHACTYSTLQ